jgi:hypothetical protein
MRKGWWPIYYSGNFLEGLRTSTKTFSQHCQGPVCDWNQASSEYNTETFPPLPNSSVVYYYYYYYTLI